MGNPVGRLEIAINYLADVVQQLAKENCVEVIVTDWGSEIPLKTVLNLSAVAASITHFIEVPIAVVKGVQKDSPFAEVLALNAAARHASGDYIGRIDQDTLVGQRFLRQFFNWLETKGNGIELGKSFMFCQRRQIPFDFAVRDPSLEQVQKFLHWCGPLLTIEVTNPFFRSPVGIMLLHKDLWMESGGYDERLLYWGWMEVDLAYRLASKYALVDIGKEVGYDFYHLEHYDHKTPRKTPRMMNPMVTENLLFHPNNEKWGLVNNALQLSSYPLRDSPHVSSRSFPSQAFVHASIIRVVWSYSLLQLSKAFGAIGRPKRYQEYIKRIGRFLRRFFQLSS
jgi:hypothetical protein